MTKSDATLVLFTASYPYDVAVEYAFLDSSIQYLSAQFKRVIIVPADARGERRPTPDNVEIDLSYSPIHLATPEPPPVKVRSAVSAWESPVLFQEVFRRPAVLSHIRLLKILSMFVGSALRTRDWVDQFIRTKDLDVRRTLFYTYWLDVTTLGLGLAKKKYPGMKLVSRAHGWDLYEERAYRSYLPCRRMMLKFLDRLFLISDHGKQYISRRYPWIAPICEVHRLGIQDPKRLAEPSTDGVFRIVSCSMMVPVKRLSLLVKGLAFLGNLQAHRKFEWHHLGDGVRRAAIEDLSRQILPPNVPWTIHGRLTHEEVLRFYDTHPVDLFVNVSKSEGAPVSIMEAQGYGILVVAPSVGGIPEVVSPEGGLLLSPDPPPYEVAHGMMAMADRAQPSREVRQRIARHVMERYDASRNFSVFAEHLRGLVNGHESPAEVSSVPSGGDR